MEKDRGAERGKLELGFVNGVLGVEKWVGEEIRVRKRRWEEDLVMRRLSIVDGGRSREREGKHRSGGERRVFESVLVGF